jgi:hypothetical protein
MQAAENSGMDEIAERIAGAEKDRAKLAAEIRASGAHYSKALEHELVYPVEARVASGKMCAVDGGLLAQEFYGFDLLLSRAVAVLYEHDAAGKVKRHEYWPSKAPEPKAHALGGLDLREFAWHQSLFRLGLELDAALKAAEKFEPSMLFLDGSLAPQIADKPAAGSELREMYEEVIARYRMLFEYAQAKRCAVVGVIKDSRGKRFMEIIGEGSGKEGKVGHTTDTSFLGHLLKEGERTFMFSYVSKPDNDPVIKDLGEWGGRVNAFYLKPCAEDRPMRVEFLEGVRDPAEIASTVQALSRINKRYAYPAILIEADMRAALDRQEMDRAYRRLFVKAGGASGIMKLRRDERPFR